MTHLPDFLLDRVRQAPPRGSEHVVVPGSTPVVSFGNCLDARVATLSLNPSADEFLGVGKQLLTGRERRLATTESLDVESLVGCSDDVAERVVADCFAYFGRNPYRRWFSPLDNLMRSISGASYWDGTACHLDIVQWATDPKWAALPQATRMALAERDFGFLAAQVGLPNLELILVNGSTAIKSLQALGVKFRVTRIEPIDKTKHANVFTGVIGGTLVCGWNFALAYPPETKVLDAVQDLIRGEMVAGTEPAVV